jgi:hypothetical protein
MDQPPGARAFLRFFGTLCSIPVVQRIGCTMEGALLHHWVQLNDDDEAGQDAIFDALRRFQTAEDTWLGGTELHLTFADEGDSAFPPEADILFVRE